MIIELGVDARLLRLQLDELYGEVDEEIELVLADYPMITGNYAGTGLDGDAVASPTRPAAARACAADDAGARRRRSSTTSASWRSCSGRRAADIADVPGHQRQPRRRRSRTRSTASPSRASSTSTTDRRRRRQVVRDTWRVEARGTATAVDGDEAVVDQLHRGGRARCAPPACAAPCARRRRAAPPSARSGRSPPRTAASTCASRSRRCARNASRNGPVSVTGAPWVGQNVASARPCTLRERVEVGAHVAVGRTDHGGAPAHDVIAGEQRPLLVEREAHVVRRVAGRVHGAQRPAGPVRGDLAVGDAHVGVEVESVDSSIFTSAGSPSPVGVRCRRRIRRRRRRARAPRRCRGRSLPCGPKATVGAPVSSRSHAASGEWSAWQCVTRIASTVSPSSAAASASRCASTLGPGSMTRTRRPVEPTMYVPVPW